MSEQTKPSATELGLAMAYTPCDHYTGARLTRRFWSVKITDPAGDVSYCCDSIYGHKTKANAQKCVAKRYVR
ncbi:MAG: hypothetical protein WBM50_21655 [Acidimicrobiales bacterium]